MDIEKRVKEIVAEKMAIKNSIELKQDFMLDLGADSLDQIEMVMAFEDEFHIEISDDDSEKIKTVEDAVKYIQERLEKTC